jgi:hypothetical protein
MASFRSAAAVVAIRSSSKVARAPSSPTSRPTTVAPAAGQPAQIDRLVAGPADQLQRRLRPRRHHVVDDVGRLAQDAKSIEPAKQVVAAIEPRHPRVLPGGDDHAAAGPDQLVGDLQPRRRRAHHQHAAGRQRLGRPVVARHD